MFTFCSTVFTDWIICNPGVEEVLSQVEFDQSAEFNSKSLEPYTVNGAQYGLFKTAGNFSYLSVFNSGHFIPAFQPVLALQVFTQAISRQVLSPT